MSQVETPSIPALHLGHKQPFQQQAAAAALSKYMSAEVHIKEMVTTQLEHWQAFVLPCETDHGTPGESPVPSPPPEELSAPAQRGAMQLAVNIITLFKQ